VIHFNIPVVIEAELLVGGGIKRKKN